MTLASIQGLNCSINFCKANLCFCFCPAAGARELQNLPGAPSLGLTQPQHLLNKAVWDVEQSESRTGISKADARLRPLQALAAAPG